jgi:hypothetical protein
MKITVEWAADPDVMSVSITSGNEYSWRGADYKIFEDYTKLKTAILSRLRRKIYFCKPLGYISEEQKKEYLELISEIEELYKLYKDLI